MKYKGIVLLIILGFGWNVPDLAQPFEYPYEIEKYDFIRYDLNRFKFYEDSSNFEALYQIFDNLISKGEGKLKIVHIGGSHLQADVYSDRMRKRMQTFQPGINGGRGLVFPYKIAGTNNPTNFNVSYSGTWENCKNVEKRKTCTLGLSGMSVTTYDTNSTLTISLPENQSVNYDFNTIKVFHQHDSLEYNFNLRSASIIQNIIVEKDYGYTEVLLEDYVDQITLTLEKKDSLQTRFVLYGLSLETQDPGVVYHSIGVNGAKIPSYLRCNMFSQHLQALEPDWVILSIGTNDAYNRYFKSEEYKISYDSLLSLISQSVPNAAILLTVPNDSYLYRRYINRNTDEVRKVINELAREHHFGVWDFYSIMGGLNSIIIWQRFGLARNDKIHFTRKGYILKGDLFFNAFLKGYDHYIDNKKVTQRSTKKRPL